MLYVCFDSSLKSSNDKLAQKKLLQSIFGMLFIFTPIINKKYIMFDTASFQFKHSKVDISTLNLQI